MAIIHFDANIRKIEFGKIGRRSDGLSCVNKTKQLWEVRLECTTNNCVKSENEKQNGNDKIHDIYSVLFMYVHFESDSNVVYVRLCM